MSETIRIAKLIAHRGLASRREAEVWISEGRVTLNGKLVKTPATLVSAAEDVVCVDGEPLPEQPDKLYVLLYKPKGYITSRNPGQGRKSVLELVEHLGVRVEAVGRLDYDTEGALLLTNDGELAHALTHPSREVPKRYLVKVYRTPDVADLKSIESGVYLDDGRTLPAKVRVVEQTGATNAWVEITVTEGRNRLIRRIFEQLKHPVAKLRRESFATLSIRGMERGDVRVVTGEELRRVRDIAQGMRPEKAGRLRRKKGFARPKPKPNAKPRSRSKSAGKRESGKGRGPSTAKRNKRKST